MTKTNNTPPTNKQIDTNDASKTKSPSKKDLHALGKYLRKERLAKKITVDDAAHHTNIRKVYIYAIENYDLKDIEQHNMNYSYIYNLLRIYIKYLGLDEQKIHQHYITDFTPKEANIARQVKQPLITDNMSSSAYHALWLGALLLLVLGYYIYYNGYHHDVSKPTSLDIHSQYSDKRKSYNNDIAASNRSILPTKQEEQLKASPPRNTIEQPLNNVPKKNDNADISLDNTVKKQVASINVPQPHNIALPHEDKHSYDRTIINDAIALYGDVSMVIAYDTMPLKIVDAKRHVIVDTTLYKGDTWHNNSGNDAIFITLTKPRHAAIIIKKNIYTIPHDYNQIVPLDTIMLSDHLITKKGFTRWHD